jgi:hypothetical protein
VIDAGKALRATEYTTMRGEVADRNAEAAEAADEAISRAIPRYLLHSESSSLTASELL